MITPPELDKARRDLERLSGGDLRKAELLVNQTIEKGWQKIYRLQEQSPVSKNGLNTVYQNDYERDIQEDLKKNYKRFQRELKEFREKEAEELKAIGIVIDYSDNSLEAVKARMKLKRELLKI
jgi:hypothetical protein